MTMHEQLVANGYEARQSLIVNPRSSLQSAVKSLEEGLVNFNIEDFAIIPSNLVLDAFGQRECKHKYVVYIKK